MLSAIEQILSFEVEGILANLEEDYNVYFEFFPGDNEYYSVPDHLIGGGYEDNVFVTLSKTGINGRCTISKYIPKRMLYTPACDDARRAVKKVFMDLVTEVYNKACKVKSVIGVKGFRPDWTCRNFKYEIGKTYSLGDLPLVCCRGFHFCISPINCVTYYKLLDDSKYALVIAKDALVDSDHNDKVASDTISVVCDITDVYVRCMAHEYGYIGVSARIDKFNEMLRRTIYDKIPESREYLDKAPKWLVSGLGNTMNARRMAYDLSPVVFKDASTIETSASR